MVLLSTEKRRRMGDRDRVKTFEMCRKLEKQTYKSEDGSEGNVKTNLIKRDPS